MHGQVFVITLTMLAMTASTVVYGVGGSLAIHGAIQLGTLVAMTALLVRMYAPIGALAGVQVDVMTALVSFDRVFELLDLESQVAENPGAVVLPRTTNGSEAAPAIEFDRVSFGYPAASEVSLASLESIAIDLRGRLQRPRRTLPLRRDHQHSRRHPPTETLAHPDPARQPHHHPATRSDSRHRRPRARPGHRPFPSGTSADPPAENLPSSRTGRTGPRQCFRSEVCLGDHLLPGSPVPGRKWPSASIRHPRARNRSTQRYLRPGGRTCSWPGRQPGRGRAVRPAACASRAGRATATCARPCGCRRAAGRRNAGRVRRGARRPGLRPARLGQ